MKIILLRYTFSESENQNKQTKKFKVYLRKSTLFIIKKNSKENLQWKIFCTSLNSKNNLKIKCKDMANRSQKIIWAHYLVWFFFKVWRIGQRLHNNQFIPKVRKQWTIPSNKVYPSRVWPWQYDNGYQYLIIQKIFKKHSLKVFKLT